MADIRSYLVSVTAAAILCSCVIRLAGDQAAGKVVRLICGLFLAFTVIRPVADIQITDFALFTADIQEDARDAASAGEDFAREAMADIIKAQTEAYILDKAQALGLTITVSVMLSDDPSPVPASVRIAGDISPYSRSLLQTILEQDLGIAKEDQLWTP